LKKNISNIQILKSKNNNEDNFVYATIYEQNLWTHKTTGEKFTICKGCNSKHIIKNLQDGYCPVCETPLGDFHGDLMSAEAVEKGCWSYLKNISDKAILATKTLSIIQDIIDGESDVDITSIVSELAKNKYHVGFSHSIFNEDIGYPAEMHNVREEFEAFGDIYEKVTWKGGFVVCDSIFQKCKEGEIVGFSFGGNGTFSPLLMNNNEVEDEE